MISMLTTVNATAGIPTAGSAELTTCVDTPRRTTRDEAGSYYVTATGLILHIEQKNSGNTARMMYSALCGVAVLAAEWIVNL